MRMFILSESPIHFIIRMIVYPISKPLLCTHTHRVTRTHAMRAQEWYIHRGEYFRDETYTEDISTALCAKSIHFLTLFTASIFAAHEQ